MVGVACSGETGGWISPKTAVCRPLTWSTLFCVIWLLPFFAFELFHNSTSSPGGASDKAPACQRRTSLVAQRVKHLPSMQETWVQSLGGEDPLEKERATHSSVLAWKTPWTEKPGGLQSMESQRVGHDWVTSLSLTADGRDPRDTGPMAESGRHPGGGNATHSSVLAWEIPRTEEPGVLRSTGSRRVDMTEPLSAAQPLRSLWVAEMGGISGPGALVWDDFRPTCLWLIHLFMTNTTQNKPHKKLLFGVKLLSEQEFCQDGW